jgi:hypothetical protein
MTEPISDEELARIRLRALTAATYAEWHQVCRDVGTLAAEVDRLRARLDDIGETTAGERPGAQAATKRHHPATPGNPDGGSPTTGAQTSAASEGNT